MNVEAPMNVDVNTLRELTKLQEFARGTIVQVTDYRDIKRKRSLDDAEVEETFKKKHPAMSKEDYDRVRDYAGNSKVMMPILNRIVNANMNDEAVAAIGDRDNFLTNIKMPTKMLIKFLAESKLPTYNSIQCVFDFDISEISKSIINGNDEESKKKKKDFVGSLRRIDKTGNEVDVKLDSTQTTLSTENPLQTTNINLTIPNPTVVFSKYLTYSAKRFEDYYKAEYKKNKDALVNRIINNDEIPAIPLYFISACQARKKNKYYKDYYANWKNFADTNVNDITDDGEVGKVIKQPPAPTTTFTKQKDWDDWTSVKRNGKNINIIPNRVKYIVKDDKFSFTSFHINIVFFFDGLIYSLGYGLDQNDPSHTNSFLATLETAIKNTNIGNKLIAGEKLFGQGLLFSPDSIDTEKDTHNFKILDIGILGTAMINNINAIFSKIKVVNAAAYVDKAGPKITTLQYDNFSAPLTYIYSRLATNMLPQLQGTKFYNCSSFIENITGGRLSCGIYSDPKNCKTSTPILFPEDTSNKKISEFLTSFFKGTLDVGNLEQNLDYNPFTLMERVSMRMGF